MVEFLHEKAGIFIWTTMDILSIIHEVMVHHLNIDPSHPPVCRKKRSFILERQRAIKQEVEKLLKADFIHEV